MTFIKTKLLLSDRSYFRKLTLIVCLLFFVFNLLGCAPSPSARLGVKANVPNEWQGQYPYAPPDSSVNMGSPPDPVMQQR